MKLYSHSAKAWRTITMAREFNRFEEILGCHIYKGKYSYSWHEDMEISETEIQHLKSLDGNDMLELFYNDTFSWGESYSVLFIAIGSDSIEEQFEQFIKENNLEERLQGFNALKPSQFKDVYEFFKQCRDKIQPLMQALHKRHPVDWYDYLEPDATEKEILNG